MEVCLSDKYCFKYNKFLKQLNNFNNNSSFEEENLFSFLYSNVSLTKKIEYLSTNTLYELTNFLYNVTYVYNDNAIEDYMRSYNFVIRDNNEYRLLNDTTKEGLNNLTNEEYNIFNTLRYLYKRALCDLSINGSISTKSLPIDAIMVAKGLVYGKDVDNIIKEEIINSSYGKDNGINFIYLNELSEEQLLRLHDKVKVYSQKSISNSLYSIGGNYRVVNDSDSSYLVRRIDHHDLNSDRINLKKNRYVINCSIINSNTPSVYPDLYHDIILGYSNISPDKIIYMSAFDAYTAEFNEGNSISQITDTNNMLLTIEDLEERTFINSPGYNEIIVINTDEDGKHLDFSYILARNKISSNTIKYAKSLDKPIVRMKTKKKLKDRDILYPYVEKYMD